MSYVGRIAFDKEESIKDCKIMKAVLNSRTKTHRKKAIAKDSG
jgi:hypothetical protein